MGGRKRILRNNEQKFSKFDVNYKHTDLRLKEHKKYGVGYTNELLKTSDKKKI